MALFLIECKTSFIATTIAVDEKSFSMHLIVLKISNVVTSIGPWVLSLTLHFVYGELALVSWAIVHDKLTLPMPITTFIVTLKVTVSPFLFAMSVLFIIDPGALIDCLIGAYKLSLTMLCVILPVSYVIATIWVDHPTVAIVLITCPVSIIAHAIWPHLATFTMLLLSSPLASI